MSTWLRIGIVLLPLLCCVMSATAQQIGPNDACRQLKANESGTARADITVDVTAVQVVPVDQQLCAASVTNRSATNTVRCAGGLESAPTATAGATIDPGRTLNLAIEAQRGLQCIRDTAATGSVVLSVWTLRP